MAAGKRPFKPRLSCNRNWRLLQKRAPTCSVKLVTEDRFGTKTRARPEEGWLNYELLKMEFRQQQLEKVIQSDEEADASQGQLIKEAEARQGQLIKEAEARQEQRSEKIEKQIQGEFNKVIQAVEKAEGRQARLIEKVATDVAKLRDDQSDLKASQAQTTEAVHSVSQKLDMSLTVTTMLFATLFVPLAGPIRAKIVSSLLEAMQTFGKAKPGSTNAVDSGNREVQQGQSEKLVPDVHQ